MAKHSKLCYPRKNKQGEIISYRFFYTGKNPITGEPKQYTHTWKVPKGLSAKEIEVERKKAELEFIKESENKSNGSFISDNNIRFDEFADQWLEEIRLRENSYGSYVSAKNHLPIIKQWFGHYLLRNISPLIVQNFYNFLISRTYLKTCVTVKQSVKELFNKPQHVVATECGINRLTLRIASKVGSQVSMETARAISSHFNVPLDRYFNVEERPTKYSAATNWDIRTTLVMILNSAKKKLLIEHNFATKDYTTPVTGTVKEKEIYNEEDAREFLRLAMQEPDPRKKALFALYLFLGLRNAEVCGLEWPDFDLDSGYISIKRNSIYFRGFGVITKDPKTKNSKRVFAMPPQLTEILKAYKVWWDYQKEQHGDLWQYSTRLFLQDDGRPIHPCTPSSWLKKFQLQNGLTHIPPHALRHTSITLQLMAGVPIKAVSQRAGHANENITLNIYTHLLKEEDKRAAETFNRYLSF